jgi:hypothetical protein
MTRFCESRPLRSSRAEPSKADEALALTLKVALALVDVRFFDRMSSP